MQAVNFLNHLLTQGGKVLFQSASRYYPAPLEVMQDALAAARAGGVRSAEGEPTGAAEPAGAEAAATSAAD